MKICFFYEKFSGKKGEQLIRVIGTIYGAVISEYFLNYQEGIHECMGTSR